MMPEMTREEAIHELKAITASVQVMAHHGQMVASEGIAARLRAATLALSAPAAPGDVEDENALWETLRYSLHDHVEHQTGAGTNAPTVIFADADYEIGDGTCGLHPSDKQANEPAIVYVRADSILNASNRIRALAARVEALQTQVQQMIDASGQECGCGYDNPDDLCLGHHAKFTRMQQRVKALEEAVSPLAVLGVPSRPRGNAGAYSIRHEDILRARALLADKTGESND